MARWTFGAGAASASAVWFFALGYGARHSPPLFFASPSPGGYSMRRSRW